MTVTKSVVADSTSVPPSAAMLAPLPIRAWALAADTPLATAPEMPTSAPAVVSAVDFNPAAVLCRASTVTRPPATTAPAAVALTPESTRALDVLPPLATKP